MLTIPTFTHRQVLHYQYFGRGLGGFFFRFVVFFFFFFLVGPGHGMMDGVFCHKRFYLNPFSSLRAGFSKRCMGDLSLDSEIFAFPWFGNTTTG
ncbi:hypothetical protein M433DRAFT_511778 [Acidomyces richmondensis BFW]|nr:MAG: hypothetical protein FE78DRAFT_325519 [Acidomyces sp. 'richmondensis']KYG40980.1 hypothetical protein M433DRAFT_511778 [Acidomyces richmondensis BFW]